MTTTALYTKALNGEALTKQEITGLLQTVLPEGQHRFDPEGLAKIYDLAHRITRKFMGDSFDSCSIINAKSGNCPEDCKWCSQSAGSRTKIDIYPLISKEKAIEQALYNSKQGIRRFSLVTSGRRVSKKEVDKVCDIVKALPAEVIPCVSLGLLDKEDMEKLYAAGVTRYHCNIETSPGYFGKLCTTHTTADKIATLRAAREAGMSLCSGGIIGMGETLEDRIDMALYLRDNRIFSIPINLLHPIPGTPLENSRPLSEDEYLLSVSLFRIINPKAFLRFAGGRALLSKQTQQKALYIGMNSAIMGDMLTTLGSGAQEDIKMFTEAGYDFTGENQIEKHIWHPYASVTAPSPLYFAEEAHGVKIKVSGVPPENEKPGEVIDGMSSWWAAIHGYNHPELNRAATAQIRKMSHVMFGGFTHFPARELTRLLLEILPKNEGMPGLSRIFYSDSGSVSVEVALKMAAQYWASKGVQGKVKFATVRSGYHGDTWNAMGVCDPVTGMHSLFGSTLPVNFFAPAPQTRFRYRGYDHTLAPVDEETERMLAEQERRQLHEDIAAVERIFSEHAAEIAGFILEPVVQGAGGMRFYSPQYLVKLKELCEKYDILLLFDEIATGFGRTGKMFALEHTGDLENRNGEYILPDIMTIGKGLTGGYLTLAATLCTDKVAEAICNGQPGVFMHGPTFMGNPLACAVACASIQVLKTDYGHLGKIKHIERKLAQLLAPARQLKSVNDVRVLGAIGVIEMKEPVELSRLQPLFVEQGIWLRPFGKLVYTMPPYIISDEELETLCTRTVEVLKQYRG